jgi:hypothetical protein
MIAEASLKEIGFGQNGDAKRLIFSYCLAIER